MKFFLALTTLLLVAVVGLLTVTGKFGEAAALATLGAAVVSGFSGFLPATAFGGNTLTNLIPDFYAALDVVSRELTGIIPAAQRDSRADRCALNATMRSHVAPSNAAVGNVTPAMALPTAADQTIGNVPFVIQKSRFAPFSWTGEEQMGVETGPGYLTIQQDQIAQAIRALVNEIEADLCSAAALGSSRAFGATAGTAPVLADYAQAKKILDDNGAPMSDRHFIINTSAGVALRNTANLFKVNEAGESGLLRQGVLGNLYGFDVRESAQIVAPTAGSMASAVTTNAALTVGQTVIPLKNATGTGTVSAGDIITLANDTNKYVVASASFAGANPATGDTITLAAPGIRVAQTAGERAITVFATSSRNIAMTRNALLLGTRLPALPREGDMALDRTVETDPNTGLSFELAVYPGYRMVTYHLSCAWGVKVMKPEHIATIIG